MTVKYTDEDLLSILDRVAEDLGRTPTMYDIIERGHGPYPTVYQARFSSPGHVDGWNNAIKMIGLKPNKDYVDQFDYCRDCGTDGYGNRGRLIMYQGAIILCRKCYDRRYNRERR